MIKVNREVFKKACEAFDIVKGDMVLACLSFKNTGIVKEGTEAIIGGFLDVIGNEGTLIFPPSLKTAHIVQLV